MSAQSAEVGIVRMPACNLQSVYNAIYQVGFDPILVDQGADFDGLSHLIVPGVGNFTSIMSFLRSAGLVKQIQAFAASGRPLLGICAGMQLLAESGTEGGQTEGLGLISGSVRELSVDKPGRLPHVGWNSVQFQRAHPVFSEVKSDRDFYFVHSYALKPEKAEELLGETTYAQPFASIVGSANIIGFQFHPEKSQINGLRLLENFCRWDGLC